MTIDIEDLFNSISSSFSRLDYIKLDEIPDIELYMDQVTTFIDDRLKASSRDKYSDEKLLTKTMINNYAKNGVIPSPVKKKYNRDHMLLLIMIYYFKSMLQISDIKELLDPINHEFFGKEGNFGIEDIYKEIFEGKSKQLKEITQDVMRKEELSRKAFEDAPEDMQDYLQLYYFICMLGADVFVKKLLIEKIVDSIREHHKVEGNKYDVTATKKAEKEAAKALKATKPAKDVENN